MRVSTSTVPDIEQTKLMQIVINGWQSYSLHPASPKLKSPSQVSCRHPLSQANRLKDTLMCLCLNPVLTAPPSLFPRLFWLLLSFSHVLWELTSWCWAFPFSCSLSFTPLSAQTLSSQSQNKQISLPCLPPIPKIIPHTVPHLNYSPP